MHKKRKFFFCHIKMKFYFLWHVIIFLLLRDNKCISPLHNILKNFQNKNWCCMENNFVSKQKVWCCTKSNMVSTKKSWCCTKKCFISTKTGWCYTKRILCASKKLLFFPEWRAIIISFWSKTKFWRSTFYKQFTI